MVWLRRFPLPSVTEEGGKTGKTTIGSIHNISALPQDRVISPKTRVNAIARFCWLLASHDAR